MYIRTIEGLAQGPLQYGLGAWYESKLPGATNGKLYGFNSKNGGSRTAVYVPDAARGANPLCLLVWIHGDLICDGEGEDAVSYVKSKTFPLAQQITDSKLPLVLVAPTMHWRGQHRHTLGSPKTMNAFLEEVRIGLTNAGWPSAPSFGRLILAGHSRAYAVLNGLAKGVGDAESSNGALATLTDVWMLDTTYGQKAHCTDWLKWAKAKTGVNLRIFYIKNSSTAYVAECIGREAAVAGLKNVDVKDFDPKSPLPKRLWHCAMPQKLMRDLIATAGNCPTRSNGPRPPRPAPSPAPSPPLLTPRPFNGSLFQRIQNALASGQWYLAMSLAVLAGDRDASRLTNMIFFARRPELKGRKLAATDPLFKHFSREWLDIRDRLVRPFLEKRTATQPVDPKSSMPAGSASASTTVSGAPLSAAARAWLAAPNASSRARYENAVRIWIRSPDRSGIELIPDASQQRLFLERVDWLHEYFPGNQPKSAKDGGRLAEALFNAMARIIPERRVPQMIRYQDVAHIVRDVPNNLGAKLYPEAKDAFVRMRAAAAAEGIRLVIGSSWRSAKQQRGIAMRQPNPLAAAARRSAHMYGLAVDLRLSAPGVSVSEADTRSCDKKTKVCEHMANVVRMYRSPVYKWMALHGREFGWFPYRREPWHWEYNPPGFARRFETGARA